jgi:hypothetical protein
VLMQRNAMYRDKECESLKQFQEHKQEELRQLRSEMAAREAELERLRADIVDLSSANGAQHA